LNRYDGYRFKFYGYNAKDSNSITPGWFDGAIDNKNEVIWISGNDIQTLYSFNPATEKFTRYTHQSNNINSLIDGELHGIVTDSSGTLWIATAKGLCSFDPKTKKFKLYTHQREDRFTISNNNITQIEKDADGNLWLVMSQNNIDEVDCFDPRTGKVIVHTADGYSFLPRNINHQAVTYQISAGRNGNLWISSGQKGLYGYNIRTKKSVHYVHNANLPYTISNKEIGQVLEDHSGNLWIRTYENLLDYYDSTAGKFYHVSSFSNPNNYFVTQIFVDKSGKIWIATQQDGIYIFNTVQKKISHCEA